MNQNEEMISSMFPDTNANLIKQALKQSNGNIEQAIDALLSGSVVAPTDEVKKEAPKTLTQEEEDELFARQLQEQLELENSNQTHQDELLAKSLQFDSKQTQDYGSFEDDEAMISQEDWDEIIAKQLQFSDNQVQSPLGFGNVEFSSFEGEENFNSASDLPPIDPEAVSGMLTQIKGSFVPLLQQQLQGFSIPPIDEQVDAGKLGVISLGVGNVSMSNVNIPTESVEVVLEGSNQIKLVVSNISASLQEFTWYFRKETFPKLKDTGKGSAAITDAKIQVKMGMSLDSTGPNLRVTSSSVNIGKLDIKTSGTKASFLYNLIISAFKNTIKSTLEKGLADMLRSAINENSTEIMDSFDED